LHRLPIPHSVPRLLSVQLLFKLLFLLTQRKQPKRKKRKSMRKKKIKRKKLKRKRRKSK
jgi:hypothetical protein